MTKKQNLNDRQDQDRSPGLGRIDWPSWPQYGPEEWEAVDRVIKSNQLYAADEVRKFEDSFAKFLGVSFAVAMGNATQGLHLSLAALGVGAGDEVIVTPYSWISSASCILMQNAIPVFCDIEPETFGIDPQKLESLISSRTRAVILVHMFGYPAKIHQIKELLDKYDIPLIEDASHAHGAKSNGQSIGAIGKVGVFSLHQRKSLSVGDGGILTTDDEAIFQKLYRLRSFGDSELSYNYRMSEFAAALGSVGLTKLDEQNRCRVKNFQILADQLAGFSSLEVVEPSPGDDAVFYAVLLRCRARGIDGNAMDGILSRLQTAGLPIRKTWSPLHRHPHFNPSRPPARGLPWKQIDYTGRMAGRNYSDIELSVAEYWCPDRLLELYVHPPAGEREMTVAARMIMEAFG